ncbi:MAG TPA: hypothetical protein VF169_11100 [Albitalea sp.]|uniref:hypothetical protein n=1 Tax=Piscinibacter sp. TaxID=1903157 RepID=UPI002ED484B9
MTIHDRIQDAVRLYMGRTYGKYPLAIVVGPAVRQQLLVCPCAISKMRTAHVVGGAMRYVFTFYLGMWLLACPEEPDFALLGELPADSAGRCLNLASARSAKK